MSLFSDKGKYTLDNDDRACAINLAFFLDVTNYDKCLLQKISTTFNEEEKQGIYNFWKNLSPMTARAYLCMAEFEGRI